MADDTPAGRVRLLVLFGGQSAEHDVSCVTARHVLAAADPDRFDVVPVGITRDGRSGSQAADALAALHQGAEALRSCVDADRRLPWNRHPCSDRPTEPLTTVVLPLLHGPLGEDGTVQGLLDLADVAYVGAGRPRLGRGHGQGDGQAGDRRRGYPPVPPPGHHRQVTADARSGGQVADQLGLPGVRQARQHGIVHRRVREPPTTTS